MNSPLKADYENLLQIWKDGNGYFDADDIVGDLKVMVKLIDALEMIQELDNNKVILLPHQAKTIINKLLANE
jgi:hypothetical protein